MSIKLQRRSFLQLLAASVCARSALAAAETATIGWPNDIPSWDPNQRFTPDAQPIFKAVFDQPLEQDPQLRLVAHLIKQWELAPDGLSMKVELRDDVVFHNGDKMTSEDFR
jgi:peptide/nickel transport system substrate-binding protein